MELTPAAILQTFQQAVAEHNGTLLYHWSDDNRLLARSTLPEFNDTRPGDKHQAGVALRSTADKVWVHPYVFRLICTNGVIMAQTIQTQRLEGLQLLDADDALEQIRAAVECCCRPETFESSMTHLRSSTERNADLAISMMGMLQRLASNTAMMGMIMDRFFNEGDHSVFGLVNATTSVARDTRDPDTRWKLEEYAGELATLQTPAPHQSRPRALRINRRDAVTVG